MNNNAKYRIVKWSVITLILIAILVIGLIFNGLRSGFSGLTSYEDTDEYSVGAASIKEKIDSLDINWISGSVRIEVYDGDAVELRETSVSDTDDALRYVVRGGKLTVQYRKSSSWFSFFGHVSEKDLTVMVPRDMAADMKDVTVETTSADISVTSLSVNEELRIDTVSGDVSLEDVTTKDLACGTVSGEITAENLTAVSVSIDTVSGDTHVGGDVSKVEFDSTSGDLELHSTAKLSSVDTDTVSGDVTLVIPEDNGFTAELDTVSGELSCDDGLKKQKDKYIYGDGSADFSFESVSGCVNIRFD